MPQHNITEAVQQLAKRSEQGVCAYIYDLPSLSQHASMMVDALPPNCQLFYAAKANPKAEVLQSLAPIVDGFEAASGGELSWLKEQLPEQDLIFGGPGKLDSEIELAIHYGIELLHVESLYEIRRVQSIAERLGSKVNILLRMNIPIGNIGTTKLAMGGKATPFGIDSAQLPDALSLLKNCPNIILKGFHFHLMSHQLCRHKHLRLMSLYFATFKRWQAEYALTVEQLNVGGGIGINYQNPAEVFEWRAFCDELETLITLNKMQNTQIRFECGRFVSAGCGYYCMEVIDIKQNHGEYFVVAKGGTHHFRTPAAQNHDHPFEVIKRRTPLLDVPTLKNKKATLVGQLCTPKDILAKSQLLTDIAVGDYLLFGQAGAYAWNISHQNFLMHSKPDMVFLRQR
ncbi:type III PLP-dependent enzyme [Catenovulum sediminis]|uniref:Type III PLP-dependent enzyme n=1 Tax=Catenovulum sediminis TaxID=1740262 RepID=A0ABV1RCL1_9ALTE|nr:type III PLP-dependent enzyme [Catenovulum sediminis]